MKYKAGDKVKIKSWEVMEKEYGLNCERNVFSNYPCFVKRQEEELNKLNSNRVLTVEEEKQKIDLHYCEIETYRMKEIGFSWSNKMIECLVRGYVEPKPILTRFEILDL